MKTWMRVLRWFGLAKPIPHDYGPYYVQYNYTQILRGFSLSQYKTTKIAWLEDDFIPIITSVALWRDLWSDWKWVD